ncbi:hypothetical protein PL8927_790107 [Planktothrix serta PCC 8927]|uniref:Effector-associated domain-containing protein n=1 Tax=Planktothrix serta PCC 8927 TaxID=671068 RepID=A0A7Z9E2J5_9CYAN|nr:hypothetical protein [Planktothrix serta]VXD24005.1 hypothetical protein PL8927_790107 [Planktothrix serta PCC 8927]
MNKTPKGKKNRSYGVGVKYWVKGLFKVLLELAEESENWLSTNTVIIENLKIDIFCENKVKGRVKRQDKQSITPEQVKEALNHYFSEFLEILEDKRKVKKGRGADIWEFKLTLWCEDLNGNLECFDQKWEAKYREWFPENEKNLDQDSPVSILSDNKVPSYGLNLTEHKQNRKLGDRSITNFTPTIINNHNLNINQLNDSYPADIRACQKLIYLLKSELYGKKSESIDEGVCSLTTQEIHQIIELVNNLEEQIDNIEVNKNHEQPS